MTTGRKGANHDDYRYYGHAAGGAEPAWDAAMRERLEAARGHRVGLAADSMMPIDSLISGSSSAPGRLAPPGKHGTMIRFIETREG